MIPPTHPFHEELIAEHLRRHLGPSDSVLHAFLGQIHCYHFPPYADRDFGTIVTMGLSGLRMPVPDVADAPARSELLTYVPADLPVPETSGMGGRGEQWPYEMLRSLAHYAVAADAWLGALHTVPNMASDPPGMPFSEGSSLTCQLILPPVQEAEDFAEVEIGGERVGFLVIVPLTSAERALMQAHGFHDSLAPLLDSGRIPRVIDPRRRCAVAGRGAGE